MKSFQQMNAYMIGLVLIFLSSALGQTYGPNGCVSISRSQQGTCVIATKCEDGDSVNLDKLEFAFDCQTKAQIQKHSFGVGGFDPVEEFDTGIKCGQCKVPQNHKVHKVTKKSSVHMFAKRSAANEDALVDKYGPGDCVETFRSTTGTCMVKTQCKKEDINDYDFGLLCVHNVTSGENVRHLFGKNSFDPEEEFDTLIKCEKCLGLKADASQAAAAANMKSEDLVKKVNTLVDEVGAMQTGLEKIKDDVKVLNEKVPKLYTDEAKKEGEAKEDESKEDEAKKEGEAKEDESKEDEAKDESEEKKAELFLSHHRSKRHIRKKVHKKLQQRHHHKKHRSSDEDEDNDNSKADDEGSDDSSSSQKDSREEDDDQDEDDSKDQDHDQDQDQDQEDSDDKKVDDDAKDSEEAN